MEDHEIVCLYWERDQKAIQKSQDKYGESLRRLAFRFLHNKEDAEECVSDTYLKAWQTIPPQRPERLDAYLFKICRRHALGKLDWNHAQKRSAQIVELTVEMEQCIPAPLEADHLQAEELGQMIGDFLKALPEEQRLIFLRRYWYADPVRDIAQRYGIGESKVKVTLHRTRKKLKAYLMEREAL